jgi:hypothetical protein
MRAPNDIKKRVISLRKINFPKNLSVAMPSIRVRPDAFFAPHGSSDPVTGSL